MYLFLKELVNWQYAILPFWVSLIILLWMFSLSIHFWFIRNSFFQFVWINDTDIDFRLTQISTISRYLVLILCYRSREIECMDGAYPSLYLYLLSFWAPSFSYNFQGFLILLLMLSYLFWIALNKNNNQKRKSLRVKKSVKNF